MLMQFGLTHQEAKLYIALHGTHAMTGYELAKATGISRSNTYAGLSNLVEKGGLYMIDGKPVRYQAVALAEFCECVIHRLQVVQNQLQEEMPKLLEQDQEYITIRGHQNIRSKIEYMIRHTENHIYIVMDQNLLYGFYNELLNLLSQEKKVVIISDQAIQDLPGASVYCSKQTHATLQVICDSKIAITGDLDETQTCTCLYSCKKNLIDLLKDAIRNEMKLIQYAEGEAQ